MNGRLQLIEQKLIGIDSAAFQNLCDIYLARREEELASINRTGSQLGKQKTVKGTPDTFFRLNDGSLRYIEYTTTGTGLVDKIKDDIDKCLDETKTGVPATEINKIVICFNSRLKVSDETEITQHAQNKGVKIELIGLDWLAVELYSKYLILAKDILGIPIDTGQLLPISDFIKEYNNKGSQLSTPLDNQFLHRKAELQNIDEILNKSDILIISGFAGVGKTKIALEALTKFIETNKDYSAYAVSKKDTDIYEDLRIHLLQDKNYILLVDDANRQLINFKQILGVYKEVRKGNIKLLITVRNYAFQDVRNECAQFDPSEIVINKFTDEEIKGLISSESFEIHNSKYQRKIIELADGNARLAIMAARLAKQKQQEFLFDNVSELYDFYFQNFIKDFDISTHKTLAKTLGIISFFFTVNRGDKAFIEQLLQNFSMDYYEFNEAIEELHRRELIEIQYNIIRVSEQVMATYFFYKCFIGDSILSFDTLIRNYFTDYKNRFKDTIIPANNAFGYDDVLGKINDTLDRYLNLIRNNEKEVLDFFELFWFYKREEMLTHFYLKVLPIKEQENPIYNTKYGVNQFAYAKDEILNPIAKLFIYYSESYLPSLELAFEYARKNPEGLPELIKLIRENTVFDEHDEGTKYPRQIELFKLLIKCFKERKHPYIEAFFAITETFLAYYFQHSSGGRGHTISLYSYPFPRIEETLNLRRDIWTTLFESYEEYPTEVLHIITNYRFNYREVIKELLEFDMALLLTFIQEKLVHDKFEHIYLVKEMDFWLDRMDFPNKTYKEVAAQFGSEDYDNFRKLDWNMYRGKQDYEFENYEEFARLKESDLRISFVFHKEENFQTLYTAIDNLLLVEKERYNLSNALDIIIEENFKQNANLGFRLLEDILNKYYKNLGYLLRRTAIAIISESTTYAEQLWQTISSCDDSCRLYLKLDFFEIMPNTLVSETYKNRLIDTINTIDRNCTLRFECYEKFEALESAILSKILKIVVDKIEASQLKISLWFHFFEKYSEKLSDEFDLLAKAYIQQDKFDRHFDMQGEGLKTLIQLNPRFIISYIKEFYDGRGDTHNQLPFVWEIDDIEILLEEAFEFMIERSYYLGIGEHSIIIFFNHLNDTQKERAKRFILYYISKYSMNTKKMNAIFDIVRHRMDDFFEECLLYYLSFNSKVEDFEDIYWRGNGGVVYSGDVNFGEIEAQDWRKVIDIVNKAENQLNLIPIKAYLKKQLEWALKHAESERIRKFIDPRW